MAVRTAFFIKELQGRYGTENVSKGLANFRSKGGAFTRFLSPSQQKSIRQSIVAVAQRTLRGSAASLKNRNTEVEDTGSSKFVAITSLMVAAAAIGAAYYFVPGASLYVSQAKASILNSEYVTKAWNWATELFKKAPTQ